jgi:predicted RNase H-like HicB family nuclease
MKLTAVFRKVPEGYVAFVEELPGANTHSETLDEARANIEEAVAMVLEANREFSAQSRRAPRSFGKRRCFPPREGQRPHPCPSAIK